MTREVKDELINIGIDLDSALERFLGNEDMYERFLRQFVTDEYFDILIKACDDNNCEEAFKASHTLKGLCGNLSINSLFDIISNQVEYFRSGDFEKGSAMMPEITALYKQLTDSVIRICGDN